MTLFTSIEVEVVGKKLNHGGGHGLEIPIKYCFYGLEKIVQWLTKKLKTLKEEIKRKISKYLKKKQMFGKHLTNHFLYSSSLPAKITSKLFKVSPLFVEKKKKAK